MKRQYLLLRGVILAGLWLMIVATYRLWLMAGDFPQIPFFKSCTSIPVWVDYCLLALMAVISCFQVFRRGSMSQSWKNRIAVPVLLASLVALDQQRFQPWVYLVLIQLSLLLGGTANAKLSLRCIRIVMVSVYVYSALSKFDYLFFEHLGMRFVDTLFTQLGMNPHLMTPASKMWGIWMIPIGELLVGVGLALRRTRWYAIGVSVALHALLIVILGPWGLGHYLGVLVWNVLFALQVIIAFGFATPIEDENPTNSKTLFARGAVCVTVCCVALPILEIVGPFDHWPAWSLYSDRTDKIEMFIETSEARKLPPSLSKHLGPSLPFQPWRRFYLEQWTLAQTRTPIYPEDRLQMAIANYLTQRYEFQGVAGGVKLTVYSAPNRMTGERESVTYVGRQEVGNAIRRFRLNTVARNGL